MKIVLWALTTLALGFLFSSVPTGERRNYRVIKALWSNHANSTDFMAREAERIAFATEDPDIRIVALQTSRWAETLSKAGYRTLGQLASSSKLEAAARGFVVGLDPIGFLTSLSIVFNEGDFTRATKAIEARYEKPAYTLYFWAGGVSALLLWALFTLKRALRSHQGPVADYGLHPSNGG